jgi:hypothetical protein
MLKKLFILLCFLFLVTSISFGQEETTMKVDEMIFCTAIEERQPVGADTAFADTIKNVLCFTKITGASDTTKIFHVWKFNDEEKAKVPLTVKSNEWRTWSSKAMMKEWAGEWQVDVILESGDALLSKKFTLKSTTE